MKLTCSSQDRQRFCASILSTYEIENMAKWVEDFLEELGLSKLDLSLDISMLMSPEMQLWFIEKDVACYSILGY